MMDIKNWKTEWNFLCKEELRLIRSRSSYEVSRVEGEALDTLLRVETLMRRLRPMGEDHLRYLWLPVMGKSTEWLLVASSQYEDHHYLQLRLQEEDILTVSNTSNHMDGTPPMTDIDPLLSSIERYVGEVVRFIEKETDSYNQFVDKNLNPRLRTGLIPRKTWSKYCPDDLFSDIDKEAALSLFRNPSEPRVYPEITLRIYLGVRRVAHEAIYGPSEGTDQEVLGYSTGMHDLQGYDLDSPEDFERWRRTFHSLHGLDVVYARVHLTPRERDGGVSLSLSVSTVGHLPFYIKAALGLDRAGLTPILPDKEDILSLLEETDTLRITPHASYYLSHGDTLTETKLPSRSEIGAKALGALVKEVSWEPLEKALPI